MSENETTTPDTTERPRLGRRRKNPDSVRVCRVGLVISAGKMRALKAWLDADTDERSANEAIQAVLFREIAAWEEAGRPAHDSATGPFAVPGTSAPKERAAVPTGNESDQMRRTRERRRIAEILGPETAEAVKLWKDNTRKAEWKRQFFHAVETGQSYDVPDVVWHAYAAKHGTKAADAARAALMDRLDAVRREKADD